MFAAARAYAKGGADRPKDLVLEALVPVVEGRLPLLVNVSGDANIRDAVAFAEREKVRIIIAGATDAHLVAPLLKEKNIPVIICTTKGQDTDKAWGMRQGARDYIVKPVDADELVAKIKAFD